MNKQVYCSSVGKICYDTRREAENAVRAMRKKGRKGMSVYQCRDCGMFHTTSMGYGYSKDYVLNQSKLEGIVGTDMGKKKGVGSTRILAGAFDDGIRLTRATTINKAVDWLYENEDLLAMCTDINLIVENFKQYMNEE